MPDGAPPRAERNLRLFVALAFPDDVRAELRRVADAMRTFAPRGTRWANVDGAHLTLRFIGAAPPDAADALGAAVVRAVEGIGSFELSLSCAGVFPARGGPRVLWVGVGGELDALAHLQRCVEGDLASAGMPREDRAFSPHVTLARVNARLPRPESEALRGAVTALDVHSIPFTVEEVGLYHSDLLPTGAVYTRLASARLRG